MKLTKTKLKRIIKEELGKVLRETEFLSTVSSETPMRRKAEHAGWLDYKDDGGRGDYWESYEGGKYLDYYEMGHQNAAEEEEMDLYYSEEEGIE